MSDAAKADQNRCQESPSADDLPVLFAVTVSHRDPRQAILVERLPILTAVAKTAGLRGAAARSGVDLSWARLVRT